LLINNLRWVAYYKDGKVIHEGEVSYGNLPRKNLKQFCLVDEQNRTIISETPTEKDKLFYRRRMFGVGPPNPYPMHIVGMRREVYHPLYDSHGLVGVISQVLSHVQAIMIVNDTQFREQWFEPQWTEAERI